MSASIQQLSHSIVEINQNAGAANAQADEDLAASQAGGRIRRAGDRGHGLDQEVKRASERYHPGDQRDRQPDQPAGPECGDRGGTGRRARAGLCRRRRRGAQAGGALQCRRQGDHCAHQGIDPSSRRWAQLSEKAGESLAKIVQGVEETAASITKIAQATKEQTEASAEVNKAIQSVSSLTETNASSSEELSASAEELGAQAESLKNVISGFKV